MMRIRSMFNNNNRRHLAPLFDTSVQAFTRAITTRSNHHATLTPDGSALSSRLHCPAELPVASFQYVRILELPLRLRNHDRLTFDLAREGVDFSIWMVTAKKGLSEARYEHLRQTLEKGLGMRGGAQPNPIQYGQAAQTKPLSRISTIPRGIRSSASTKLLFEVVAVHDGGLGVDDPLRCSFVFLYPYDQDPTVILPMIGQDRNIFGSMSRLVPVLDAIQEDNYDGSYTTRHATEPVTLPHMAIHSIEVWYTKSCEEARLLQGIAGFRCLEDMSWWWAEKSLR